MGQCCESLQTCFDQIRFGGAKQKPKKEKKQKGLINLNIGFGVMDEYIEEQVEKEKINNDLNYQLKLRLQQLAEYDSDDEDAGKIVVQIEHKKIDNKIMDNIMNEEDGQHHQINNDQQKNVETGSQAVIAFVDQQQSLTKGNGLGASESIAIGTSMAAAGAGGLIIGQTWSSSLYGGLLRKKDKKQIVEEVPDERKFNVNLFQEDKSLTDILSFCSQGLVRQKNCEPPIYTSNYSYELFCEDTTDHVRSILLRDELDSGEDQDKGARWKLWLGMHKTKKNHQYQVKITYYKEDPKLLDYQEQEYAKARHLVQKLNQIKGGIVLKVVYESFSRRKIFMDCYDTIHVQVKESAFFSMRTVISQRLQQEAKYKEEEIMCVLDQLARGLHEAKKMNLPHGNINDECIVINQETLSYKIDGFGFFMLNNENRILNSDHTRPIIKQYLGDQQKKYRLLFLSPEVLNFYTKWIDQYSHEKEQEYKQLRQERDDLVDQVDNIQKTKNQKLIDLEDKKKLVEYETRILQLNQYKLDDDLIDLFKSDVYQLGIVILKMMTLGIKESHYIDKRPDQIEVKMMIDKLSGSGKINLGVPVAGVYPNLAPIVIKMLSKKPSDRPSYLEIIDLIRDSFGQQDKPAEMLYINNDLLPKPIQNYQIKKGDTDLNQAQQRFEKIFQLGCIYIDIKNYQEACNSFEQLLDDEYYDILELCFKPISILQSQFLLGYAYAQMRFLEEAFIMLSYLFHHLMDAIEQDKADTSFYKILYYLAYINFIADNHIAAKNYMTKLIDNCNDYMLNDDRESWVMCKMLEGQIYSDLGDHVAAKSCFLGVKKYLNVKTKGQYIVMLDIDQLEKEQQDFQEQQQMNQHLTSEQIAMKGFQLKEKQQKSVYFPNELIEACFYLGVEYYFEGSYNLAYKQFDKTLKMILQRHCQSMFTSIKLMTLGYLSELNYYFNNIKNLNIYIQKSYDMIQSILRTEGEFLDVLLTWFNKFSFFFTVYINKKEMFQLLEIFQIGLSRPGRILGHDIVFRDFVIGRSFYFSGSLKHTQKYLLQALKSYNESTKTVKSTFQYQEISSYQIKQEKLARMKQKELEKQARRSSKKIKSQKYQRPVDRIIVAFCYHWLYFIYKQLKEEEKAKECSQVYQEIYEIEIRVQQLRTLEYYCNLALIKFTEQDKNCLDYFNNAIYQFEKMGIMHLSLQMLFQYSNLLAWAGLLHLIKKEDQNGFYFMNRSLEVFLQFKKQNQVVNEYKEGEKTKDADQQISGNINDSPGKGGKKMQNKKKEQQGQDKQGNSGTKIKQNKKMTEKELLKDMNEQKTNFDEEPVAFIVNVHLNVALNCLCLGLFQQSHEYLLKCYEYSKVYLENNNTYVMMHIDILFLLGYTAQLACLEESILLYYLKCFQYCLSLYEENSMDRKNTLRLTSIRDYIARIYIKRGYYLLAQEEIQKSYEEFQQGLKENEGLEELAFKQAALASVLLDTCNYDKAKLHIVKAVQRFQGLGSTYYIYLFTCKLKQVEILLMQQNSPKDKNEGRKLFKDIISEFRQIENPSQELRAMMFRVAATYYLDPSKEKKGDGTKTELEMKEDELKDFTQTIANSIKNKKVGLKRNELQRQQEQEKKLRDQIKNLKIQEIQENEKSLKMAGVFFNKAYEMYAKSHNKAGALDISIRVADLFYQMLDFKRAFSIANNIKYQDLPHYLNEVILADAFRLQSKIYYWTTKPEQRKLQLRGKAARKQLKKIKSMPQSQQAALAIQLDLQYLLQQDTNEDSVQLGIKGNFDLKSVLKLGDDSMTAADKMEIAFNIYQSSFAVKVLKKQEAKLYHCCLYKIRRGKLSYFDAEQVINQVQEVQAMYYQLLQDQSHPEIALACYVMGLAKMWRVVFYRNYKLLMEMITTHEEAKRFYEFFMNDKKSKFFKEKQKLAVEFLQTREFINQKKQKMSKKVLVLECKQFINQNEEQFYEVIGNSPPGSSQRNRNSRRLSTMPPQEGAQRRLQRQITIQLQEQSSPVNQQQQSMVQKRTYSKKGQFMESQHDFDKALKILKQLNISWHPYIQEIQNAIDESFELEELLINNQ